MVSWQNQPWTTASLVFQLSIPKHGITPQCSLWLATPLRLDPHEGASTALCLFCPQAPPLLEDKWALVLYRAAPTSRRSLVHVSQGKSRMVPALSASPACIYVKGRQSFELVEPSPQFPVSVLPYPCDTEVWAHMPAGNLEYDSLCTCICVCVPVKTENNSRSFHRS